MKRIIAWILVLSMVSTLFGCKRKQSSSEELWVVTEATTWDHMNGQVAAVATQFEKDHPGLTVRIDILPTDEQERSVYIQQLRTQILRGGGPDVYLMPTADEVMVDAPRGYTWFSVDPLFPDVVQAMENGMFRDISSLYDGDTELGKETLKTTVMDAGVVDGKRYVLPLRYDIPVIYADVESMNARGFSTEDYAQNADRLLAKALEVGDRTIATMDAFSQLSTYVFTQWMDYSAQRVTLDANTIAAFMKDYQSVRALRDESVLYSTKLDVSNYCYQGMIEGRLYVGSLADLTEYAPVYQYEGRELAVLPLHAIGGDVVADVTYYGAVGSGCKDPEQAYAFLRMFLLEDSQWEKNRPQSLNAVGEKGRKVSTTNATQVRGLIEKGWPVRIEGSVNPLWAVRKKQFYNHRVSSADPVIAKRRRAISMSQMDRVWDQILSVEPDQVRFGSNIDGAFREMLLSLNDPESYAPTDVDIDALAESFWWQLRWHVAEG